jgi:molybdopterin-guanine dinucleotide biosynthesis protein A
MEDIKSNYFPDTYGLVMCGGNSSRMGTDKSMLQYFEKPQRYYVYDMLLPYCEKVFISCNNDQANSIEAGYNFIPDDETFSNIGPMAALLTAFTKYPDRHMLLIGCDYPFLKAAELEIFSKLCIDIPVSFYNKDEDVYEPMLAWYPYTCFDKLKTMYDAKQFSLQHFLKHNNAIKYLPFDINSIKSIDTSEDFSKARNSIKSAYIEPHSSIDT